MSRFNHLWGSLHLLQKLTDLLSIQSGLSQASRASLRLKSMGFGAISLFRVTLALILGTTSEGLVAALSTPASSLEAHTPHGSLCLAFLEARGRNHH